MGMGVVDKLGARTLVGAVQPVPEVLQVVEVREAAAAVGHARALALGKQPPVAPPAALQHAQKQYQKRPMARISRMAASGRCGEKVQFGIGLHC